MAGTAARATGRGTRQARRTRRWQLDAAILSVGTPPRLLGDAPWAQRAAGSLRAGLQRACAGLPDQVRGLLPGLIDGDTTHLDPAVSDAFRATGMTHMVAVSGCNVDYGWLA